MGRTPPVLAEVSGYRVVWHWLRARVASRSGLSRHSMCKVNAVIYSYIHSMRIVCAEGCIRVNPVVCGSRYGVCAEYMGSGPLR